MTFTRKINRLFQTATKLDGNRYTAEEIAIQSGINASYIYRLLSGAADNPTYDKMCALADAFGVSPVFFMEKDSDGEAPRELRTPLNTIMGLLQVWQRVFRDDPVILQDVREMESETIRLLELFIKVLSLPETSRAEIAYNLQQIIHDTNRSV